MSLSYWPPAQENLVLELYHGYTSVCAQKARLALAEKGLLWASHVLLLNGDQLEADYLALNPNGVVPTLVHNGLVILESTVIVHYVNDAFTGPPLMPRAAIERARVHAFNKLVDEYVHPACVAYTFATVNRGQIMNMPASECEQQFARTPLKWLAECKREAALQGLDSPRGREATRSYLRLIVHMRHSLERSSWLAGADFSLADIAVIPYMSRLDMMGLSRFWEEYPVVSVWWERAQARSSFTEAIRNWLRPEDIRRYESLPDLWPDVQRNLAEPE